jgi:hypothetical protein
LIRNSNSNFSTNITLLELERPQDRNFIILIKSDRQKDLIFLVLIFLKD